MENVYNVGLKLYQDGEYLKAIDIFKKVLEVDYTAEVLNYIGVSFYCLNDLSNCEIYLKKVLELSNEADYLTNLGILYNAKGEYDLAEEFLLNSFNQNDKSINTLLNLANVKRIKGEYEFATQIISQAISLDPNNVLVIKQRAQLFESKNDFANALGDYTNILKNFPDDIDTLLKMANIYLELNIYNEALSKYKKVFELQPAYRTEPFINSTIRQIYNKLFPTNRFTVYNSTTLQELKEKILALGVEEVLEVTSYEGILSLILSNENLKSTFLSDEEFFIEKAKLIAKNNNFKLNTFSKSDIYDDTKLLNKQDLIINDLWYDTFPSFDKLKEINYFKSNFLKEAGKLCPEKVVLKVALLSSEELYLQNSADKIGSLDISVYNDFRAIYLQKDLSIVKHEFIGDEITVENFDLYQSPKNNIVKKIEFEPSVSKLCHGVVFWTEKFFNEEKVGLSRENSFIYLFDKPVALQKGEVVDLEFIYSNLFMFFLNRREHD